jgi:hypothetical protein
MAIPAGNAMGYSANAIGTRKAFSNASAGMAVHRAGLESSSECYFSAEQQRSAMVDDTGAQLGGSMNVALPTAPTGSLIGSVNPQWVAPLPGSTGSLNPSK